MANRFLCLVAAAGLLAASAATAVSATVISQETTAGNTYPTTPASSTDLFQTHLLSVAPSGGDNYLTGPAKYNGTTGSATENSGTNPATVNASGTYDFTFDTSTVPAGYRIDQVAVYTGWGDFRAGQDFRAFYSVVGDSSFVQFADVNISHSNGTLRVNISDDSGPIAGGVDQLRFIVDQSTHVYRKIDVFGAPMAQLIQPGGAGAIGATTFGDAIQNLAPGGTATQSTNYNSTYVASLAIDGDYNNFSHTNATDAAPWWQVNLGSMMELDNIQIFNRSGYDQRLVGFGGFRVEVLEADGTTVAWWHDYVGATFSRPFPIDLSGLGVEGQIVRLSKLDPLASGDNRTFNLAEVEVNAVVHGDFRLYSGGTLEIELACDLDQADKLALTGELTIDPGTTLNVLLLSGTPAGGQTFDILDFSSVSGTFDTVNLPGGASLWDLQNLYITGEITFVVPEPATMALLTLAATGLGGYLRRRRPA